MWKKQCFSRDFGGKCGRNNVSREISTGNAEETSFLGRVRQKMWKKHRFLEDFDKKCGKNDVSREISAGNAEEARGLRVKPAMTINPYKVGGKLFDGFAVKQLTTHPIFL
jgi:hypothetical protein